MWIFRLHKGDFFFEPSIWETKKWRVHSPLPRHLYHLHRFTPSERNLPHLKVRFWRRILAMMDAMKQTDPWKERGVGDFFFPFGCRFPKIGVGENVSPQIIPFVHRVWNPYFHHPFWGTIIFGLTPISHTGWWSGINWINFIQILLVLRNWKLLYIYWRHWLASFFHYQWLADPYCLIWAESKIVRELFVSHLAFHLEVFVVLSSGFSGIGIQGLIPSKCIKA